MAVIQSIALLNCRWLQPTDPGLYIPSIWGFSPSSRPQTRRPNFMLTIKKPILSTLNLRSSIIKQHCQKGQKNEFYFEKIE
jgi:hypothetical protein